VLPRTKRRALLALLAGVLVAVPGPHDSAGAAFAGKNGRIAFARGGDQDDGLPFHIHTVTLATGKTIQLTSGRVQDLLPAWQPL
jgi:hypothetical protein